MPDPALARDARCVFNAAVAAVQPEALLDAVDLAALAGRPLDAFRRVIVVGAGKASIPLARAVEARIGFEAALTGEVAVPTSTLDAVSALPARIAVRGAGHPVPTAGSVEASTRALALAQAAGPDDLVLALVSGGGSALWAAPAAGLTLADVQATTRLLLASGVPIEVMNAARKHLSTLAGGQLARAAAPARLVALVLSDVVGDDLATIASGPTVPDPTTYADALDALRPILDAVPPRVRRHLERGASGDLDDTPGAGDAAFATTTSVLLGSNRTALEAARREAERLGYRVAACEPDVEGEARRVGRHVARRVLDADIDGPTAWLWGGETTVTVTGDGRGGRNQEVALAAALALDGASVEAVVLSGGTDGIDGPTDAAGGIATSSTVEAMQPLDAMACLDANDAYTALETADALLWTGPTGTNVADIGVALRRA